MNIAIAADHGGYQLKEYLKQKLLEWGHQIHDFGTDSPDSVDYPAVIRPACQAVSDGEFQRGLMICGSGIGASMVANKVKGIRCALVSDPYNAVMSRRHNDANVIALGARMIGPDMATETLKAFLDGEFEGGRHQRRVDAIEE